MLTSNGCEVWNIFDRISHNTKMKMIGKVSLNFESWGFGIEIKLIQITKFLCFYVQSAKEESQSHRGTSSANEQNFQRQNQKKNFQKKFPFYTNISF